jgi:hypothetical protein
VVLLEAGLWLFLVFENCCLMNYKDGFWLWVMDDLWLILGEILADLLLICGWFWVKFWLICC